MKGSGVFYLTPESVEEYFQLAEGIDGAELISKFQEFLPEGKSVLEIGMGPGKDLDILKRHYRVTGSDFSQVFLEKYAAKNPETELLQLDAKDLKTSKTFDAVYSNKVLHHLKTHELEASLTNQHGILNENGLICHSFWKGSGSEEFSGMLFQKYEAPDLEKIISPLFEILQMDLYSEFGSTDSILVIARKKE